VQTEEKFIGKWRVRKGYKERERGRICYIDDCRGFLVGGRQDALPLDRSDEAELDHRKRTVNQSHPYNITPERKAQEKNEGKKKERKTFLQIGCESTLKCVYLTTVRSKANRW
jgi:hypothetical protein